jgi:hypothetical protein
LFDRVREIESQYVVTGTAMSFRPAPGFRWLAAIVIVAFVGVVVAGLHARGRDDEAGKAPFISDNSTSQVQAGSSPLAPAAPPDPEISLLGTDSSISPVERSLVLVATAPEGNPGSGTASLGTDPRNPQTYAAGARLANGAVLQEIYSDYVVLDRDGEQSLLLKAGAKAHVAKRHQHIGTDSSVSSVGGEESVNQPLEKIASSREDLSEIIRVEPFFERDEYAGLKILPGIHGGRLEQLDLQPGDIVRTIEGRRAKSADAAWQALDDAISTGTPIVVGIERDGSMMSISIDGSRLASTSVPQSFPPPGT